MLRLLKEMKNKVKDFKPDPVQMEQASYVVQLQQQREEMRSEIDRLRSENEALRVEIENLRR